MKVKKGKVPYGEAYEATKKKRDEETRKKQEEALNQSYKCEDDSFDVTLGAMVGSMMATDNNPISDDSSSYDTSSSCDYSSSCDTSSSFD